MRQVKVDRQPAYVLHTQPYRETSLLVEVLSRDHGRFTLVARGARRPRSDLRGQLLPFQPLQLAWFGKGELRTLHTVDWRGGVPQFAGQRLVCGFYLNELLLRLSPRDDPSPELFQLYDRTVRSMARSDSLPDVLRRFELNLLTVLGYTPPCSEDAAGQPLQPDAYYLCCFGELPQRVAVPDAGPRQLVVAGASLLALAVADFSLPHSRRDVRGLLRLYLDELLGPEPLATRELLTTLYALQEDSAPSRRPS